MWTQAAETKAMGPRGRWAAEALLAAFFVVALVSGTEGQGSDPSCVGCHTDAAKLKALTPPDPPASEAGEG